MSIFQPKTNFVIRGRRANGASGALAHRALRTAVGQARADLEPARVVPSSSSAA